MLGADSLLTGIIAALYSRGELAVPHRSRSSDALQGDPEVAFLLADFYYNRENGAYLDNSTEAFRAYNCMDYPADATDEAQAAADALIAAEAPTIAPYWSGPDPCEVWPYPPTGTRGPITADGAAPIVVVGTTNDPATPYEWSVVARRAARRRACSSRASARATPATTRATRASTRPSRRTCCEGTVPEDGLRCE